MKNNAKPDPPKGRGRPRKSANGGASAPTFQDFASTSTTPPGNRYSQLNNDEELSDNDSWMEATSQTSKKRRISNQQNDQTAAPKAAPKPPPMNIRGKTFAQVQQSLAATNVSKENYQTKLLEKEVRVFASNDEDYKKIFEKLREENAKFYTHQTREQQTTKFVLHGLYKMTESELQKKLEEAGIKPSSVKILTIRQQKYSDHCVYLLHFPKVLKVKISKLREIKAIDQVIVRWEYYKNKRNGPIQCGRCMQFGHGKQSCFLDPVCMRCGNGHETKDCDLLMDPQTSAIRNRIPDERVKCGLCGGNHTANYSKCKKREEFIDRQNVYRQRTQRRNRQQPNHYQQSRQQQNQHEEPKIPFVDSPQLDGTNFPSLPQRKQQIPNFQRQEMPPRPQQQSGSNEDLLTPEEAVAFATELLSALSKCTTRKDQFAAITATAIKFNNYGFAR